MTEPPKTLGIAGSPRRGGNTEMLLDRFLAGAESAGAAVEKVVAARLKIAGCVACDGCWEDGHCVVQDDFQAVYEKLVAADVIVLAAPLYFWSLPAQLKALIDRAVSVGAQVCRKKAAAAYPGRSRPTAWRVHRRGWRGRAGFPRGDTDGRGLFWRARGGLLA